MPVGRIIKSESLALTHFVALQLNKLVYPATGSGSTEKWLENRRTFH